MAGPIGEYGGGPGSDRRFAAADSVKRLHQGGLRQPEESASDSRMPTSTAMVASFQ